jgi:hypothetical protein
MLFQYAIIFIFKVLHVSSSLNSSSGTVYEQSLKLHIASQYTIHSRLCSIAFRMRSAEARITDRIPISSHDPQEMSEVVSFNNFR